MHLFYPDCELYSIDLSLQTIPNAIEEMEKIMKSDTHINQLGTADRTDNRSRHDSLEEFDLSGMKETLGMFQLDLFLFSRTCQLPKVDFDLSQFSTKRKNSARSGCCFAT